MSLTNRFFYSRMENNYLNLRGLHLSNEDIEKYIKVYERVLERLFIENIKLMGNNLHKYNCADLIRVFPNLKCLYVSDMCDIDNYSGHNVNVVVSS